MPDEAVVRMDHGDVNRRILARQSSADYRRVEQASIKQRTNLQSPEAKRLFARFFHSLQLNAHFVCDIARIHLSSADVEQVEETIRKRLEKLLADLNRGIESAAALFVANGISATATYETLPLELDVGIISSFGRRYLEAIQVFDRLMPMLRTLEIYEVISSRQVDRQRTLHKKSVRGIAISARQLATGLRRRISELAPKKAGAEPTTHSDGRADAVARTAGHEQIATPLKDESEF